MKFPLIQLPRKSEEALSIYDESAFPIVSINSTSEEVRSLCYKRRFGDVRLFPLIQLPRKSEEVRMYAFISGLTGFH